MMTNPHEEGLGPVPANYAPLTPLSFLARAAAVFPGRVACVHGDLRFSYAELYARCRRLASALHAHGVGVGDTVAVMAPNVPAMLEAHHGVPMCGAVLNALNVRLEPATIAYSLEHGGAKVLLTDREYAPTIREALPHLKKRPLVIDIDDPLYTGDQSCLGETDYETFLKGGDHDFAWSGPADEWQAIALNYTSGTTGQPKGVVYHHRGAYLNAVGNILAWSMAAAPVYLWTLPMYHCNGWCFPWTVCAVAGTHVCLRKVEAGAVFRAIDKHGVTHFCGAPVVLGMLLQAAGAGQQALKAGRPGRRGHTVEVMTAAAPPPPPVIAAVEALGFHITHVYGLTEVYGPAVVCAWHEEWDALPADERAILKARQGVAYPVLEELIVADPQTLEPRPADGRTLGEVLMRGNIVMKGYLKNPEATAEAFRGGWFHTGDLGVRHPDGYLELKDRSKDLINSGGEKVSTIEIETVLYRHPAVLEAAVVARPDAKWGETPCAFVTLRPGQEGATEAEIIAFCRQHLAGFKVPKAVVFGPLPKTSTGKIQKFVLREQARQL
jgi:fatty-acyl-CoA synthase